MKMLECIRNKSWEKPGRIVKAFYAFFMFFVIANPTAAQKQSWTGPSPDFFPIQTWDFNVTARDTVNGIPECNFTVGGFVKAADFRAYKDQSDLPVLIGKLPMKRWDYKGWPEKEIADRIRKNIESAGKDEQILGYFITDEPSIQDFRGLAAAVKTVKKYAPDKLALINLFPISAKPSQLGTTSYTEYLEQFVNIVKPQLLSYDNYLVEYSRDLKRPELAAKYYTNLLEIRRVALKYGIPFWNIVASNQIRPHTTIPSPANLRFQAYTSLAAGVKGIIWYHYFQGNYNYSPVDKSGHKTPTWWALKEVNRQIKILGPIMKALHSEGVYFTPPAPDPSLPLLPGKWVDSVVADVPVMVGEFSTDNGVHYAMVVNLSLERSAKFWLKLKDPQKRLWMVSAGDDGHLIEMDKKEGYWLTAGQGVLIKW